MRKIKNNIHIYTYVFIAVLYAAVNYIWWLQNVPVFITPNTTATHFMDVFRQLPMFNAPLITVMVKVFASVFTMKYYDLFIIIINYLFFLTTLFFVYKITKFLKGGASAVAAMLIFALTPAVYGLSRVYGHQDYHLMAAAAFNIYCLLKCDKFKNLKWSVLYGVSVAFGLMVKDSFIGFFSVPLIFVCAAVFYEKNLRSWVHLFTVLIIAFVLSAYHYARFDIIQKIFLEPVTETAPFFTYDNLSIFTIGLWERMFSLPVLLVFLTGLYFYLFKYKNHNKIIILLWLFPVWLFLLLMPHRKEIVYGAGFVPAVVIIAAIGINCIKSIKVKRVIFTSLFLICFFQYFAFTFGSKRDFLKIDVKGYGINYFMKDHEIFYMPDKQEFINCKQLSNYINLNYKDKKVMVYCPFFNLELGKFFIQDCLDVYLMLNNTGAKLNFGFSDGDISLGFSSPDEIEVHDIIIMLTPADSLNAVTDITYSSIMWFILRHPQFQRLGFIKTLKGDLINYFNKIYSNYEPDGQIVMRSSEGRYKAFKIYKRAVG